MRTERTVGTPGEPTDKFLGYCERMIELMRQHGVTPVLVFDGAPPAMKARLNEERRAQRAAHRAKADALLAQGKRAEAVSAMSKAVGVRPHMTQQLIELCRARGVEGLEADLGVSHVDVSKFSDTDAPNPLENLV